MRFFFVPEAPPRLRGEWEPPAQLLRHLRALRLQEDFLLLLPLGGAVRARWDGRQGLELLGLTEMPKLPLLPVTLASAWPKGQRAEALVARATEMGVERIVPLACARSVVTASDWSAARLQRYQKVILEACQQCGRPVPPALDPRPAPLARVRKEAPLAHPVLLLPGAWPLSMELSLHTPREVLLLVGPEGGFTPEERALLQRQGVHEAGLGPTVLRIEAAGPFAAGICQHWHWQTQSN
ncbi:MAG: 16S rRNA (uracil(1498)-N(3))-methyltransferase [Planctomycetota bacterium]|nr:MAG: 16S rRNA (uracil(1498)-N(3))-methyltransferase [Planctomycetota bacterium]